MIGINENFTITLRKTIEGLNSFKYLFIQEGEKTAYENILLNFETYGSFLDVIPMEERKNIIIEQLFPWINAYARNPTVERMNELFPFPEKWEPKKEYQKPLKVIKSFEKMLQGIYEPRDDFINHFNEKGVPPTDEEERVHIFLKEMLEKTEILRKDIEDKQFRIYPKANYYKFTKTTKEELSKILTNICDKYNIQNVKDAIKTFKTLPIKNKS